MNPFEQVSTFVTSVYNESILYIFGIALVCLVAAAVVWGLFPNQKLSEGGRTWFFRILGMLVVILVAPAIFNLITTKLPVRTDITATGVSVE